MTSSQQKDESKEQSKSKKVYLFYADFSGKWRLNDVKYAEKKEEQSKTPDQILTIGNHLNTFVFVEEEKKEGKYKSFGQTFVTLDGETVSKTKTKEDKTHSIHGKWIKNHRVIKLTRTDENKNTYVTEFSLNDKNNVLTQQVSLNNKPFVTRTYNKLVKSNKQELGYTNFSGKWVVNTISGVKMHLNLKKSTRLNEPTDHALKMETIVNTFDYCNTLYEFTVDNPTSHIVNAQINAVLDGTTVTPGTGPFGTPVSITGKWQQNNTQIALTFTNEQNQQSTSTRLITQDGMLQETFELTGVETIVKVLTRLLD